MGNNNKCLTKDVYEPVSDPGVHPTVDDRVEAGM
jgi:hypothetical protein